MPAPPRIMPSFGATTPPDSGLDLDVGERRLELERGGGGPEGEQTAPVGVGVSPSSKKWLSFFGKRKKTGIIGGSTAAAAAAAVAAAGRNEAGVIARPPAAREGARADHPGRSGKDGAGAASEAENENDSEESAAVEGGTGSSASRTSRMERPQVAEEQAKLREVADAGAGRAAQTAAAAAAAEAAGQRKSPARAEEPPSLPTYEEARRRAQRQLKQNGQGPGQGQQQQQQPGADAATNAGGFASPPAAASIRSGDAKSTQRGSRRRDSSGLSLRRGGVKATTGLVPGARVLCLDIFVSAIGGNEIRQWRPAEVEEVFEGQEDSADELQARVAFSSFAKDKQRVCLRLWHEWTRLAPPDSLAEEDMDRGAPLAGDALLASRTLYKPRYYRRQGRSAAAAAATAEAGTSSGAAGAAGTSDGSPPPGARTRSGDGEAERATGGRGRGGGADGRRKEVVAAGGSSGDGGGSGGGDCGDADSGNGGDSGGSGGGGETTDVANVKAALKMALANKDGDTSEGSGRESNSSGGGGGGSSRGKLSRTSTARPSSDKKSASAAASAVAVAATVSADGRSASSRLPKAAAGAGAGARAATEQRVRAPSPVAAHGGGRNPKISKFFADEETAVGSPVGRRAAVVRLTSPNSAADQPQAAPEGSRGVRVPGATAGGEGGGPARPGKPNQGVVENRQAGAGAGASRRKQTWRLWDMSKPPTVGDRFDCLDYFVSSQTQLEVKKWREAEVMDVRRSEAGTEVWVHYLRWHTKWNRWISVTEQPERFATYGTKASRASKSKASEPISRAVRGYHLSRSSAGDSSTASTATMTNSSVSSSGTTNASSGGSSVGSTVREEEEEEEEEGGEEQGQRQQGPAPPGGARVVSLALSGAEAEPTAGGGRGGGSGGCGSSPTGSGDSEASADAMFRDAMRRKGLSVVDVEPDGNCLFRSVSHQIFGDVERHYPVRKACVDHMSRHRARFGVFVAEDFRDYLYRIRQPGVWGDDLEIRALEELFDRPIEIYSSEGEDLRPMKIDFDASGLDMKVSPIKLSYHGQSHYNSVRDHSLKYPLQPRRSKRILQIREAQHAHTPRTAAAASFSRAGGGKAGGRGAAAAEGRVGGSGPIKKPTSRFAGLKESAPFSSRSAGMGRWGGGGGIKIGRGAKAGGGTGGQRDGGGGGSGAKNFTGMALRTFFGGVSGRVAM
eukprot:g4177.t1